MNKWILAGIYSAPMAAFAVASSISSPKLDEAPMFTAPIQKVSLDISALWKDDEAVAPERTIVAKAPMPTKIGQVKFASQFSEEDSGVFELSEVVATGPDASAPELVFAKQSAYQVAAKSLAPEAYELGNFAIASASATASSFPSPGGFSAASLPALGGVSALGAGPGEIETQLTTLEKQFDDTDQDTPLAVTSVPLPAGLPLLAGGLVAFGLLRRKQRG